MRKRKHVLEVKVWREPAWPEGSTAWRAQVYEDRQKPVSLIDVGRTAAEALAASRARTEDAEPEAEWHPLAEPGRAVAWRREATGA